MNLKNIFFLLVLTLSFHSTVDAQEKENDNYRHFVSIGAGFPNLPRFFFNYLDNKDQFSSKGTGPLHFKYEYNVSPRIGVGMSVNHLTYTVTFKDRPFDTATGNFVTNNVKIFNNSTAANLRVNYHFLNPEKYKKLDIYAGLGLGYQFGKLRISSDYPEYQPSINLPSYTEIGAEASLGVRYFFIDQQLALYLEAGLAKSIIQFGVTARF